MRWVTGNEIVDGIAIVFIVLGCGVGWLMRNFEVGDLQWEINRLKNVELCHRLWLQLQRRDAQLREYDVQLQQYTKQKPLDLHHSAIATSAERGEPSVGDLPLQLDYRRA